jgi:hypothetical protein
MDYREARRKFMTAAEAAGAELDTFRHPTEKAPDGGPLCMDTAWFGPKDAPVVLLGDKIIRKIPIALVHRVAAGIFAVLGMLVLLNVGSFV